MAIDDAQHLSLAQIIGMILQRWPRVLIGLAMGLALGMGMVAISPEAFSYTTLIDIARIAPDPTMRTEGVPSTPEGAMVSLVTRDILAKLVGGIVEPTPASAAKLLELYVPAETRTLAAQHPDGPDLTQLRVKVEVRDEHGLISLESLGTKTQEPLHAELHARIVAALAADHRPAWELSRSMLESAMAVARSRQEELAAQALAQQVEALADPGSGPTQHAAKGVADRAALRRQQVEADAELTGLRLRLEHYTPTHAVGPAQRSLRSVGLNHHTTLALFILIGLAAGAVYAFTSAPAVSAGHPR